MCGIEIIQIHCLKIREQFYAQRSQYTKGLITVTIALHRQNAREGISGAHFDIGSRVKKLPRTFHTKCPRIVIKKKTSFNRTSRNESSLKENSTEFETDLRYQFEMHGDGCTAVRAPRAFCRDWRTRE